MASFGPTRNSECGQKPGGFTRLTPEVLNWVNAVTGMEYHVGIKDPGEILIKTNCSASFPLMTDHVVSAVLITGGDGAGKSAEIYHSDRDSYCILPDLPEWREHHTQDGSLMCGGGYGKTTTSCGRWNPDTGAWDLMPELLIGFEPYHTSWTPADGSKTFLMGGWSRKNSVFLNRQSRGYAVGSSFPLQHTTS